VPKEFGGLGLTLAEICREQRRLARSKRPPEGRCSPTVTPSPATTSR
jgi:hypothetical protein